MNMERPANGPVILVSSLTYAIKSRDILIRRGIRAFVERVPPAKNTGGGCGFGVYVPGDPQQAGRAERILRENGIRVLGRVEQEPSQ